MGMLGTLTRRSFLIGSAAVAGGVAFGTYAYRKPIPNPLLNDLAPGETAITPYVKIDADGITLITPRADKGQGAYSLQAYLLAEELDVDPMSVKTSPGMPSKAYYNGEVLAEGAPFPAYDDSWIANRVRGLMDVPAKLMGMQMTGGSSTTPDAFEKLRHAGAVARETLKAAAAQRASVSRDRLRTENGQVYLPDGTAIAYTDLAAEAATVEPIRNVELRAESEWKYLGKPMQRIDMVGKCTGTEKYGIDLAVEGMVHATVRTNPGLGGDIISFDASRAEAMRGVQQVLPIRHGVAVIADNTWRAFKAANAIEIEWGPGPYPASSAEMWAELEKVIEAPEFDSRNRDDGDIDKLLASGDVFTAEYRLPFLAHAPLEPMNAIVRVNDGSVEIWTGTQIPRFIQSHVAELAGLDDPEQVRVYVQPMGGSFGRRLEDTYVLQATEIALALKGTPVKMTWTREEDFTHDYPRTLQLARGRGKVGTTGIEAFDLDIASLPTAASWFGRLMAPPPGPDATIVAGAADQPFAIPNYRVTGKRVPEMVPVSSWRSVGASGNGFLHGCFFDELCHAGGLDPMDELIRLCHHDVSRKVLEELKALSGWDGSAMGENRGRGVAFCLAFGVPTGEVVEVTNTPQGIRIDKVYVVADVGKAVDPVNLEAQLFGGVIWGLGHAMNCELTYENYAPVQTNYHAFEGMRLYQTPTIVTRVLENGPKVRGVGEPSVPPAPPALANAIFAATAQRIRELPLWKHIDFA